MVDSKHLALILSQTTYTKAEAMAALSKHSNDAIKVIESFMGIPDAVPVVAGSVNQEIYRQMRHNLDKSMREYRIKNPIDIDHVASNFAEEEENKQ